MISINKKAVGHPHNSKYLEAKAHVDARFAEYAQPRNRYHIFYILNTIFFVIISFIAGYNLKGYQVRNAMQNQALTSSGYVEQTKANYQKSQLILEDLESLNKIHYEEKVNYQAKIAELAAANTQSTVPTQLDESKASEPQKSLTEIEKPPVAETPQVTEPLIKKAPPVPPPAQPKVVLKRNAPKKPYFPKTKIKYAKIYHTVSKGEILSGLVPRSAFKDFLAYNQSITDPDLIYPGQKILIKIPMQNVLTGSYMNTYFIRSKTGSGGGAEYFLIKWFNVPESHTLISYLALRSGNRISDRTIPYIDLTDYTNMVKEEVFGDKIKLTTRTSKVKRISAANTGMYFKTDGRNPLFMKNTFRGLKETDNPNYQENINTIIDVLTRYMTTIQSENLKKEFFHFLIFGETIVQVDFLSPQYFKESTKKPHIKIGLVHKTKGTDRALITLQSSLSTCKIRKGEIAEVNRNNLVSFIK